MQIESLLSFVNGPAPEATPQVAGSIEEFANMLEATQAPPEPPPNLPTFAVVEGATLAMPNATKEMLDLPTTTSDLTVETSGGTSPKTEAEVDAETELDDEIQPLINPDVMALAMLAQSPVTTEVIDVTGFVAPAVAVVAVMATAVEAEVVPTEPTSQTVPTGQTSPTVPSAPIVSPEPKLEVSTELTRTPADSPILSSEAIEVLNPVKIEAAPTDPVNPLQDLMEDFPQAEVATQLESAEMAPKSQTMLDGKTEVAPAKISFEGVDLPKVSEGKPVNSAEGEVTKTAPLPTQDEVKKQIFRERTDFRTAFQQGLSETIERMPVTSPVVASIATPKVVTETPTTTTTSKAETKVTFDALLGAMRPEATKGPFVTVADMPETGTEAPTAEIFQLKGTDMTVSPEPTTLLGGTQVLELETKVSEEPKTEVATVTTPTSGPTAKVETTPESIRPEVKAEPAQVKEAVNQFVKRAEQFLLARKDGAITIHLEPRELGSITLTVNNGSDGIRAEIKASNHQVQQQLEANKQNLVQQVESKGLSLGSLNVSLSDSSMGQGQNFREQAQASQDAMRQSQLASIFSQSSAAPIQGSYRPSTKTDGIDYVI